MKRLWKQMTAIALIMVLIAPLCMELGDGTGVVEAATTNLVENGDFDGPSGNMDTTGWSLEKDNKCFDETEYFAEGGLNSGTSPFTATNITQAIVTDPIDSDDTCLQVQATAANGFVDYALRNLAAGETYNVTLKAYVGTTTSTETIQALIIDRKSNNTSNSYHLLGGKHNSTSGVSVVAKNISNKGWVTYSCNITASENLNYWTMRFILSGLTTIWYIDDISVKHVSEYAQNGGFDSNTDGWLTNATIVWGANYGNGNGGVQVTNSAIDQYIRTYVPVTGGQSYNFSYWFKCTDGSNTRIYTTIIQRAEDKITKTHSTDYTYTNNNIGNSANANSFLIAGTLKPDSTWRNAVGQFTAAAETVYAEVRIRIVNDTGTVYFDNFSFSGLATETDGIVLHGSDYEMKLSNNNSASYSGATLTAGKKYDYSYEVSSDAALTKAVLTVGTKEFYTTSSVFTYESGNIGLLTEGTGVAYFDDICISEHIHTDTAPNDEICDTCNENLHEHVWSDWKSNGTKHWKECTKSDCLEHKFEDNCGGGTATCITRAKCTTCGNEYGTTADHIWSGWKCNGTKHWKECIEVGCGETSYESDCAGGTATCQSKAECTECGNEHGNLGDHVMSEYISDGTKHWKECTISGCEHKDNENACSGGTATCQAKAICSTCAKEWGTLGAHTDADSNELCDVCQTNLHVHDYTKQVVKAGTLKSEATTSSPAIYYKSCACGDVSATVTFEYGNPLEVQTPQTPQTQQTLQTEEPSTIQNTYESTSPKTGDNIPVVWIYIAVMSAGVVGFCLKGKFENFDR